MRTARAEIARLRGTWVLPLAVMGPAGVLLLEVVRILLTQEAVSAHVARTGGWEFLVWDIRPVFASSLVLGIGLVASIVFDVDHRSRAWKQLFALPISRGRVFVAKTALVALLVLGSSVTTALGIAAIGLWQGFGEVPWDELALLAFLPWATAMPVLGFQALLSAFMKNQALPITSAAIGAVMMLFSGDLPASIPWALQPQAFGYLIERQGDPGELLALSLVWSLAALAVGAVVMSRKGVTD